MAKNSREAFIAQARDCLKNGQFFEAASFAEQAVEMAPNEFDAHLILGAAWSNMDRPDEAADAFLAAVRLNPNSAKCHYNLAVHFYRYGWKEEALAAAKKALGLEESYRPARQLILQIEKERRTPEIRTFAPGSQSVAPPIMAGSVGRVAPAWVRQDYYSPSQAAPRSRIPFIGRHRLLWVAALLSLAGGLVVVNVLRIESWAGLLLGLVFAVSMFLEVWERRPPGGGLALAILAVVFLLPQRSSPLASIVWVYTGLPTHVAFSVVGGLALLAYILTSARKTALHEPRSGV